MSYGHSPISHVAISHFRHHSITKFIGKADAPTALGGVFIIKAESLGKLGMFHVEHTQLTQAFCLDDKHPAKRGGGIGFAYELCNAVMSEMRYRHVRYRGVSVTH